MTRSLQRRAFDRRAARYDRMFLRDRWPRNQEWKAARVLDALDPADADLIVELGCGTGQVAGLVLAGSHCRYVGVDVSPAMLERARVRLAAFRDRARVEVASADRLPLPDAAGAGVFGVDVLHHVDDVPATLREVARVLEPGGRAYFLEGNPLFPLNLLLAARREERGLLRSTRGNYERWFADAGLDAEVRPAPLFTPPGPPPLVPVFDLVDRTAERIPLVRSLAIFHEIRARKR